MDKDLGLLKTKHSHIIIQTEIKGNSPDTNSQSLMPDSPNGPVSLQKPVKHSLTITITIKHSPYCRLFGFLVRRAIGECKFRKKEKNRERAYTRWWIADGVVCGVLVMVGGGMGIRGWRWHPLYRDTLSARISSPPPFPPLPLVFSPRRARGDLTWVMIGRSIQHDTSTLFWFNYTSPTGYRPT